MLRLERPADPVVQSDMAVLAFEMGPVLGRLGYAMSGRAAVGEFCQAAEPAGELMFLASTNHVRDEDGLRRALQEVDASLAADYQIAWNAPFRLDHIPTLAALGSAISLQTRTRLPILVGADARLRPAVQLGNGTLISHPAELAAERLARLAETDAGPTVLADVHHLVSLISSDPKRWGKLSPGELVKMAAAKQPNFVARRDRVITAIGMVGHPAFEFPGVTRHRLAEFTKFWKSCEKEVGGLRQTRRGGPSRPVRRRLRGVLSLELSGGYWNAPVTIGPRSVPPVWDDGHGPEVVPRPDGGGVEPAVTVAPGRAPSVAPSPATGLSDPRPAVPQPQILDLVGVDEGANLAAELGPMAVGYDRKSPILKRSVIQRVSDVVTSRLGIPPEPVDYATAVQQAQLRNGGLAAGRPNETLIFDVGAELEAVVASIVTFAHGRATPPARRSLPREAHLRACREASAAWIAGFSAAQSESPAREMSDAPRRSERDL